MASLLMKRLLLISSLFLFSLLQNSKSESIISFEMIDSVSLLQNTFYNQFICKINDSIYWHLYLGNSRKDNEIREVKITSNRIEVDKLKFKGVGDSLYYNNDFDISIVEYLGEEKIGVYSYKYLDIFDVKTKKHQMFDYFKNGLIENRNTYPFKDKFSGNVYLLNQFYKGGEVKIYEYDKSIQKLVPYVFSNKNKSSFGDMFPFNKVKIMLVSYNYVTNENGIMYFNTKEHTFTDLYNLPKFSSRTEYSTFYYDTLSKVLWASGNYYDAKNQFQLFIIYSKDEGKTWKKSLNTLNNQDLVFTSNISRLFISGNTILAFGNNTNKFAISNDYGLTWNTKDFFQDGVFAIQAIEKINEKEFLLSFVQNKLFHFKLENTTPFDSTYIKDTPGDTILSSIDNNVNLAENQKDISVNQIGNIFELLSNTDFIGNQKIQIYNVNGILVKEYNFNKIIQNQVQTFQFESENGVYFLKVVENENIYTKKFTLIN